MAEINLKLKWNPTRNLGRRERVRTSLLMKMYENPHYSVATIRFPEQLSGELHRIRFSSDNKPEHGQNMEKKKLSVVGRTEQSAASFFSGALLLSVLSWGENKSVRRRLPDIAQMCQRDPPFVVAPFTFASVEENARNARRPGMKTCFHGQCIFSGAQTGLFKQVTQT